MNVFIVLTTLTSGGCLYITFDNGRRSSLAGATGGCGPLLAPQACLKSNLANLRRPTNVPSLKNLMLGTEPTFRQKFAKRADAATMNNVYAPPSMTICCAVKGKLSSYKAELTIARGIAPDVCRSVQWESVSMSCLEGWGIPKNANKDGYSSRL